MFGLFKKKKQEKKKPLTSTAKQRERDVDTTSYSPGSSFDAVPMFPTGGGGWSSFSQETEAPATRSESISDYGTSSGGDYSGGGGGDSGGGGDGGGGGGGD